MDFYQKRPELRNQYSDDRVLKNYLKRKIPANFYTQMDQDLMRFGQKVVDVMEPLAQEAEMNPPIHIPYDPWGKRIDNIKVSRAWTELNDIAAEEGIVANGYNRQFEDFSRVYQFAKLYLYHPSSAIYSCPLAMTDGAARVIELHGSSEMKARAFKKLTSTNPKNFWTSGQWMTERSGGSDVSRTETIARPSGDGFKLFGVKWFTSATTSQMAMTLAKIEGEEKLSLFYVELRNSQGELQGIQINRLKDKMGTKALPTAELTLEGVPGTLVGERGKGVKTIATLFNITRLYNACCAVGYMRRGIALSKDYASKRIAFGKTLIEHGLHLETLADMQVRFEASFLLTFHSVHLLGKEETGKSTAIESGTLRLLIPLAKLFTAKESVAVTSEAIESFGGAGYIEDTGLPQILRNTQVLSIWEGTTNVLSLDVLRAIKKEQAAESFIQDLELRLSQIKHCGLIEYKNIIEENVKKIKRTLTEGQKVSEEDLNSSARQIAFGLARTYISSLMLEESQALLEVNDQTGLISLKRWIEKGLFDVVFSSDSKRSEARELLK